MNIRSCGRQFGLIIFLLISCFVLRFPPHSRAAVPFPPFSVEGNPPEDYYFDHIFPLFRFIKPPALQVYENMDVSRKYEALEICPYAGADRRDQTCNNAGDQCDGGPVDICHKGTRTGQLAYTAHSGNGSCKLSLPPSEISPGQVVNGICEYKQTPKIITTLQGTDFSDPNTSPTAPTLTYPKLQNEALRYGNIGNDNEVTWGSLQLLNDQCSLVIRHLTVIKKAKITKATVHDTGEWPLGWVDWGYKDEHMSKTLVEMNDELPDNISLNMLAIALGSQKLFLSGGDPSTIPDLSGAVKTVCDAAIIASQQTPPATWYTDAMSAPLFEPSFRQGYAHASICIWDLCCPGFRCPLDRKTQDLMGNAKALYYDVSVSQAYNAALADLYLGYPFQEYVKILQKLIQSNELMRYANSVTPVAIPSAIWSTLNGGVIHDPCFKYVDKDFTWASFTTMYEYLDPPSFLDPDKQCPGYGILSGETKEQGGSYPQSPLTALINLIWAKKVDDVDPKKQHLITIPDALGQSLSGIEQTAFDIRDTTADLKVDNDHNLGISNNVSTDQDNLLAGKAVPVGDAQRRPGFLACADPDYSSPLKTSIEQYALGTRVGCNQETTATHCDGKIFGQILAQAGGVTLNPSLAADNLFNLKVKQVLTPELMNVYAAAEKATGVPCEVIAGIHFEEASSAFTEGGNPADFSVENGGAASRDGGFQASAITAGKALLRHPIDTVPKLITAISDFNGGGNSNCQLGYPYPIPYTGCPRQFIGDDDPYATNLLDSRHTNMWLLYHGDLTQGVPTAYGTDRPGAFVMALEIYNNLTKNGNPLASPTPAPTASPSASPAAPKGSFPETCGHGIQTALGCLPFTRDAFISTLLTFIAGISGAIALVVMLIGTFQIMTAAGNSKKIQAGRELFTAALAGLLFLIFSVALLRLIAGNIIQLPGF